MLTGLKNRIVRYHYSELLSQLLQRCPFIQRLSANYTASGCEAHVVYGGQKYKIIVEPEE